MFRALVACALLAAVAAAAWADVLVLRDGRKLEGTIVDENDDVVKFKMRGITTPIKRAEIKEILRGELPSGSKGEEKVGGIVVPRAERARSTGKPELDEARRQAAESREGVRRVVADMQRGMDGAKQLERDYESLVREIQERNRTISNLAARSGSARSAEQAEGIVSQYRRLVALQEEAVKKMEALKERYETRWEFQLKAEEDLLKGFRDMDEAWVRLAEVERRYKIQPQEPGAGSGAADLGDMSLEAAETLWATSAEILDRGSLAGRRVHFEGRVGAFAADTRTLTVFVGAGADPEGWSDRLTVELGAGLEPPADGTAIFEGYVSPAPDLPVQIDEVTTLK